MESATLAIFVQVLKNSKGLLGIQKSEFIGNFEHHVQWRLRIYADVIIPCVGFLEICSPQPRVCIIIVIEKVVDMERE